MTDESDQSLVEISIGSNQLRMEGTEEFLSDQLSTILDRIDLSSQSESKPAGNPETVSETPEPEPETESQSEDKEREPNETEEVSSETGDTELHKVARRLDVDHEKLAEHFYIDDGGIHVHSPLNIEPKYALLGYCTIKEILSDDIYHDNKETKDKLIDVEKVEIDQWGRELLPSLRSVGLIKDNPNVDRDRNKPFKITPSGRRELIEWLNENN
ncbi:hypothetical protein [Haloplanus sp. C73]|uniref:hypothetical protein n=1 Tax=Haloplanus sp. C73 TaxID=3421641 RepID=UPI003EBD2E78